jgi:uncharacterized protein YndB with AHSA1/START domain
VHRNEHTIEIDRPPSVVFPYLAASDQRRRWMAKLVQSEELTDGPAKLGTRFRDVFEDHGHRIELTAEIVDWRPSERIVIDLRSNAVHATSTQALEELNAGRARLTATIESEYKSFAARLAAGVVTRHAQAQLEQDLENLKRLVESETGG